MHARALHIDPPWGYRNWSHKGARRGAQRHYPCMTSAEIAALPVRDLAAPDCALFLWTTGPFMPDAFVVASVWGFTYATDAFTWVKTGPTGRYSFGMGYWTRKNTEKCLLFTRGRPRRLATNVPELIVAPRREHSRKPDEAWDRIERLVSGPYVELFARSERPGWTCLGNALSGRHIADDIRRLADQPSLTLAA